MIDKADVIEYLVKQQWFEDLVNERAKQLLDEIMHDDDTVETVLFPAHEQPLTETTTGATRKTTYSQLTPHERHTINAWLGKNGHGHRAPSQHISQASIAAYYDAMDE